MPMPSIEYLGIFATTLVVASFIFKDVVTLRVVNGMGAIAWIVYGLIAKAPSIALLNTIVLFIQIWHVAHAVVKAKEPTHEINVFVLKENDNER